MENKLATRLIERWFRGEPGLALSQADLDARAKKAGLTNAQIRMALTELKAFSYGGYLWGLRPDAYKLRRIPDRHHQPMP